MSTHVKEQFCLIAALVSKLRTVVSREDFQNIVLLLNELQSTLDISKSAGCLKYFEISVPRHIRLAELRKNKSNNHSSQIN